MVADLLRRSADLKAAGDVRLLTEEDGPSRGQRILCARNADGLRFEIAVDRGFDLCRLEYRGINLGWHSANSMPYPTTDPSAENGWSFFRNFDGFMVTCGLDHFGAPQDIDVSSYRHPHFTSLRAPLHGRISASKARLIGYGVDLASELIFCEGQIRQSSVFGETLDLRRRITLPLFGGDLKVEDTVTNLSFRPARHSILYHLNFGHPFLSEELELAGLPQPLEEAYRAVSVVPSDDFGERVSLGQSPSDSNIRMTNAKLGISVNLTYDHLPQLCLWQAYQSGIYALGVEPCTVADGPNSVVLAPSQAAQYALRFTIEATRA